MHLAVAGIAAFVGILIGLRFPVVLLVVTVAGAVIGAATIGLALGNDVKSIAMTVLYVGTALQIGYLLGMIGRIAAVSMRTRAQRDVSPVTSLTVS